MEHCLPPRPRSSPKKPIWQRPALFRNRGASADFPSSPWFHPLRVGVTALLLSLGVAGCQSPKPVAPVHVGYEQVSHPARGFFSASQPPRTSLDYRNSTGLNVIVWPSLASDQVVIKGELALWVGDRGFIIDGAKVTRPRLLAAQYPNLPVDLTDEILWRWARLNHHDFGHTLSNFIMLTPEQTSDGVVLHLEFWASDLLLANRDWPDKSDLDLTWDEVDGLMRLVKIRGHEENDLRWKTAFIGETLNRH